jgi:hypothetical protein
MSPDRITAIFNASTCNECLHYDPAEGFCQHHTCACSYLAPMCPAFSLCPFAATVLAMNPEDIRAFMALLAQKFPKTN